MIQSVTRIRVRTSGQGLYEITREIAAWVAAQNIETGLLTIFLQHTSASLVIQENADPNVVRDLNDFFRRLAPENDPAYRHTLEGSDDMPSHIRAALTQTQLGVPVIGGRLALGTWQGIYVFEHRRRAHQRTVVLHLLAEPG